jgi:hypothetical protein
MTHSVRVAGPLVLTSALLVLTGCGGGGGGPSSPTGTATVQGQVLKEPTVQLPAARSSFWEAMRASVARREGPAHGGQPVPVPGVTVMASVNGQDMGSRTTDAAGRLRFDGIPAGMVAPVAISPSNTPCS